jgi:hypothetical protein
VLIAMRPGQEMKVELDEVFPGDAGLHHEEPVPRYVFIFHERLSRASAYELNMCVHVDRKKRSPSIKVCCYSHVADAMNSVCFEGAGSSISTQTGLC